MNEDLKKIEDFKIDLRNVLNCSKGGILLNRLDSEFYELGGEHIKYDRSKFRSLEDYLLSIPDTCTIERYGGDVYVYPVLTEKLASISKLVNQQKSISKKNKSSLRRPTTRQNSSISGSIYARRYNNHNSSSTFQRNRYSNSNSNYSSSNNYKSNGQSSRYSSTSNNLTSNNDASRRLSSSSFRQTNQQTKNDFNRNYNNLDNKSSSNIKTTNGTATNENGTRIFDVRGNTVNVFNHITNQSNKDNNTRNSKYRYEKADSVDYKQKLEEYAEKNNLGEIRYAITQEIRNRKVCGYYSRCILPTIQFSTFPDKFKTVEDAENAAAKKALNSFVDKFDKIKSNSEENCSVDDLTSKIKKLFIDDNGTIFSNSIEEQFSEKYSQRINPNWIDIIEKTDEFDIDKTNVGNNRTLYIIGIKNKFKKSNLEERDNLIEFSDSNNSKDLNSSFKSEDNQELPDVVHLDKNNDWYVLVLRATNATEVILRLVDNTEKLDLLVTELHNYYNELKKGIKAKNIIINKIYAAVFDDCVFRVQAVQLEGAQVYCWFLDDGIIEKIQKSNLYELTNEFMKLPFQAFTAQLDGLEDQSESLIRKYIDNKMKENDDSLCLYARAIKSDPELTVRLFDTSNDDKEIDINEDILNYIQDSIKNNIFAGSSNSIPKAQLPKELNVSSDSDDGQTKKFENFDVVVSLVASPHHFIVRSSKNFKTNSDYLNLNERLQEFYSRTDEHIELNESMIYPGLFICVKDDDKWCRARVDDLTIITTATSNSKCTCYLVDLGKIVVTDIENIQPLYSEFMDFPLIAIRASLSDILPINDDWSMDQIIYFKNLVEGQEFEAIVNDIIYVDNEPFLQLNLKNSSIDISDHLIKNKKAKPF